MIDVYGRLWRQRALVFALAGRELKARYRGSLLGFFWSLLNPLLLLAVYAVVFQVAFRPRADVRPYALFLFGGILAWNFLSASLLDAAETFRSNGPLLRKVIVAPEVFPASSVCAQAVHFLLALPVLAAATLAAVAFGGARGGWAALQFPLVMLLLALAVLGAALAVSCVSVHFRDLRDLLANLLTFWFFATPVIYPLEAGGATFEKLLRWNPATAYWEGIHASIFRAQRVPASQWAVMAGVAVVALAIGGAIFSWLSDSIAEEA
jgi:homopolymeric O-antigen transport system permease protein